MEISGNAFVSGLNAVQSGSARVAQAGSEIARNTVEARSPQAEQMVELTRGKLEAQSGARVIEVADETLGTLIDTTPDSLAAGSGRPRLFLFRLSPGGP